MKKGIKTNNQIAGVDVGGTFTDLISTNPNDKGVRVLSEISIFYIINKQFLV